MSEEWFDVVDEHDVVVGRNTRGEVHRLGLRHRAVHVLVFNRQGEVFLQKRSMRKDCWPGVWDSSASGHLDAGEEYDACAERELREEIGLELPCPPVRVFKVGACAESGHEFAWVYWAQAEGPFGLDPTEVEGGGWFAPGAVDRWLAERPGDFAGAFRLIWRRWRGGDGRER